jgi:hypothetical protein
MKKVQQRKMMHRKSTLGKQGLLSRSSEFTVTGQSSNNDIINYVDTEKFLELEGNVDYETPQKVESKITGIWKADN